jgi:predicted RNA binding protein YcfA (HicA-like mRNA interferase family)
LTRLHAERARDVMCFLVSSGFAQVRRRGRHKLFRHRDGRAAMVPDHRGEPLGRGILSKILRDAETAPQAFLDRLSR